MSRRFLNADQFKAHVDALPAWDRSKEDDPNWIRPTEEVTGRAPIENDALLEHTKRTRPTTPPVPVPVSDIRQTQHQINLSAVRHYVDHPHELYDQDGWLGTDHPVVIMHPDHGPVIADGNSRFGAALLRGDKTLSAHVLRAPSDPEDRAAIEQHQRELDTAGEAHSARVEALAQKYGRPTLGPHAHPRAVEAHRASYAQYEVERRAADARLHAKLGVAP